MLVMLLQRTASERLVFAEDVLQQLIFATIREFGKRPLRCFATLKPQSKSVLGD